MGLLEDGRSRRVDELDLATSFFLSRRVSSLYTFRPRGRFRRGIQPEEDEEIKRISRKSMREDKSETQHSSGVGVLLGYVGAKRWGISSFDSREETMAVVARRGVSSSRLWEVEEVWAV